VTSRERSSSLIFLVHRLPGFCRALKPQLNEFKGKFAGNDDVVFLAVTYESPDSVRSFLKKEPFDYQQIAGAGDVLKKFVFGGYPKKYRDR